MTTPDPSELPELAARLIRHTLEAQRQKPAANFLPPDDMDDRLKSDLTGDGVPMDEVVAELARIADLTPRTVGPKFFNQLFGGRDDAALLGEILAAVLNTSLYTYKAAGPSALLERRLISHMGAKAGWDEVDGVFNPGGSMSNMVGMLLARADARPEAREQGLGDERFTVYTSDQSHYSIAKNAAIMGLGRAQVRQVQSDERGRMIPNALLHAIEEDRTAGFTPMMINATAATTVMGAFDPLDEIADIAEYQRIWLHVDGAWGATILLSPERRSLMQGVERADSLAWNPHKMMGVPLSCSVLLTRHLNRLQRDIGEGADYLFQSDTDDVNFGMRSIQCGRRNDVLKLWAAWRRHGDEGYANRIERQFALAKHAADVVRNDPGLILSDEPPFLNICFEVQGKSSRAICDRLDRESRMKIGHGIVNERRVIRLICVNPDLANSDIDAFFQDIQNAAADLPEADNAVEAQPVPVSVGRSD